MQTGKTGQEHSVENAYSRNISVSIERSLAVLHKLYFKGCVNSEEFLCLLRFAVLLKCVPLNFMLFNVTN